MQAHTAREYKKKFEALGIRAEMKQTPKTGFYLGLWIGKNKYLAVSTAQDAHRSLMEAKAGRA